MQLSPLSPLHKCIACHYPTSRQADLGQEGQRLKMKEIKLIFNTIFITFIMFLVLINIFMDFDTTVQSSGQIFTISVLFTLREALKKQHGNISFFYKKGGGTPTA